MNLEKQLREALLREPAPPDFAARVLARACGRDLHPATAWWRRPAILALAACLTIAAVVPAVISGQHRRERQRAIEAKTRLVAALRITNVELRHVKEKLRRNRKSAL